MEYALVASLVSLLFTNLSTNGLVSNRSKQDETTNTAVCINKLLVNKLTIQAISAAIPNQKIIKPTVIISAIKKIPAAINQIYHIINLLIMS